MSQALYFSLCDDMELVGNDITVEYVNATADYDTIYVVNDDELYSYCDFAYFRLV